MRAVAQGVVQDFAAQAAADAMKRSGLVTDPAPQGTDYARALAETRVPGFGVKPRAGVRGAALCFLLGFVGTYLLLETKGKKALG